MSDRSHLPITLEGIGYELNGAVLLQDITLEIRTRRRLVALGPNGAGKSLFLRLCHGLIAPTSGRIRTRLGGAGIGREDRTRQAMVFQRPVLLRRSVLANVAYALAARGIPRRHRRGRAEAALARFGLEALAGRPARLLSGGEQQRLALARAWVIEPELLLLDEPTSALDPAAARAVEEAIQDFHAAGSTIVMTTHDLGQARRLADDVAFLHRGRLVEHGAADRFFQRPATTEAATFMRGELVL
jgi:tungstate transport system ATP-binding protein